MALLAVGLAMFILSLLFLAISIMWWRKSSKVLNSRKHLAQAGISEILQEDAFQYRTLYWQEPCIDCTGYALDCEITIAEIIGLQQKQGPIDWYSDERNENLSIARAKAIVMNFFDPSQGAFRQCADSPPDVQSVNDAIRIISWYPTLGGKTERDFFVDIKKEIGPLLDKSYPFVKASQDPQTGLFATSPYTGDFSIASTFSSVLSIYELAKLNVALQEDIHKSRIVDTLLGYYEAGGFGNKGKDPRLLCATYYALRMLEPLLKEELFEKLGKEKVFDFVQSCWVGGIGGYRSGSKHSLHPTLVHTRYALLILRMLVALEQVEDKVGTAIRPDEIMSFVNRCWQNGGFGNISNTAADVYSTRHALKIAKLLRRFELNGVFKSTVKYEKEMRRFYTRLEGVREFVESCHNSDIDAFAGFPLK